MKTLDEVITALNMCQRSACEKCPYYDPNVDICDDVAQSDALHYLKEFKRISARLEKIALGNITETLEKLDNPALTWDELKQMQGKPVWVEFAGGGDWMLVVGVLKWDENQINLRMVNGRLFRISKQGESRELEYQRGNWQAYRKERE